MKPNFILFTLLTCGLLLAEEVNVKDHSYPSTETAYETEWKLKGTHHFTYRLFFSVFTGAYYQPENQEGERLVFTYTRNISADDLRAQAMKHLQSTQSADIMEKYSSLLQEIQAAYKDVREGDSYAITVLPKKGIWLARDGQTVFKADNAEFGDWYLDIWMGDPPIDEGLKEGLLGE